MARKKAPTSPLTRPIDKQHIAMASAMVKDRVCATDAYIAAGLSTEKATRKTIHSQASKVANREDFQALIAELSGEPVEIQLLTRDDKRSLLYAIARSSTESAAVRLKAIDLDNKLQGLYDISSIRDAETPSQIPAIGSDVFSERLNKASQIQRADQIALIADAREAAKLVALPEVSVAFELPDDLRDV